MSKFVRFGIIGGLGFILDFTFTWFFKEKMLFNPFLANAIGFSVAVVNNFYLNKRWTFRNRSEHTGVQFGLFFIFSLIGLLLNTFLLFLFTKTLFQLNFYVGKLIAIALVFIWNFIINSRVTFKHE